MGHLTVDEMIDFVSLTNVDSDSLDLLSKVNGHIGKCRECRDRVRAFQAIYDEFEKLGIRNEIKKIIPENTIELVKENDLNINTDIDGVDIGR